MLLHPLVVFSKPMKGNRTCKKIVTLINKREKKRVFFDCTITLLEGGGG